MNIRNLMFSAFFGLLVLSAFAQKTIVVTKEQTEYSEGLTEETSAFGKWRIALGGAFNGVVSTSLRARNVPAPNMYAVPAGSTKDDAWGRANARTYDGGGYIAADSLDSDFDTENWGFPVGDYQGGGRFVLNNSYQEVVGSSVGVDHRDSSDDENQFGVSFEVSRELFIKDDGEHRWGIDLAAAFSYFFKRDLYSARGTVSRTDTVRDGKIQTEAVDSSAMYDYDNGWDSPVDGMYGHGNYTRTCVNPAFGWSGIGSPHDAGGSSHSVVATTGYSASGDYQELEMLFMLRPWYELTDWWRIYGEAGVGVSWGRFDTSFTGSGLSYGEDFDQWDCYGVAGLGTMVRRGSYDLSVDFIGRFWRDDLEVKGRHVNGTIERADWGFRVMLGYEF